MDIASDEDENEYEDEDGYSSDDTYGTHDSDREAISYDRGHDPPLRRSPKVKQAPRQREFNKDGW
jgi:hypothetical protein